MPIIPTMFKTQDCVLFILKAQNICHTNSRHLITFGEQWHMQDLKEKITIKHILLHLITLNYILKEFFQQQYFI